MTEETLTFEEMMRQLSTLTPEQVRIRQLRKQYTNQLPEYSEEGSGKWNDWKREWPKVGWKFHLNVTPQHVKEVAEFLREQGFNHKYLSGGEVESGKVFTIYTGSKEMTERAVRVACDGVGSLLDEPKASGEVLFAPRIVGRFEGQTDRFYRKVASQGITVTRERPDITDENVDYARGVLTQLYGDYFGHEIAFYEPTVSKDDR